jgi:hypothetical protein
MRQNVNFPPIDIEVPTLAAGTDDTPAGVHSRLAFVQVGVWELRRRWLAGQTDNLDDLLACLDEDVERLRQALTDVDTCSTDEAEAVMI